MLRPKSYTSTLTLAVILLPITFRVTFGGFSPLSQTMPPTPPPPPPIQVHVPNDDPTLLCASQDDAHWVRHPLNCSVFFICDNREARVMPPCPHQHVFSMIAKLCVPPRSGLDDCHDNGLIEDGGFPGKEVENPMGLMTLPPAVTVATTPEPTPGPTNRPGRPPTIVKSIMGNMMSHEACNPNGPALQPHPQNCAWYYNCTIRPDTYIFKFYETFTMECPYPQLFSYDTMRCEDFAEVDCGTRKEPRSPCEYRANQCGKTAHCKPCWVRYGSCLGRPDGPNSWPDFEWKPFFVECYRERTIYQGECDRATVFSPLSRACVSPYTVPRARGGWWPECGGRRDGLYPDEHGRCDFYYECKNGDFQDYMKCHEGLLFNPLNGKCQRPYSVPFPCGEAAIPNICDTKPNGIYLDIYGRCSHYFECKNNELLGMSLCPAGVFNPLRGDCDSSGSVVQPCGQLKNPCKGKENGYYADTGTHCLRYYLCERELTIAAFTCRDGTIFNEVAGRCMDIAMSPPPCGLAPDCKNSSDGFYPALHRGSQYYAECRHERFAGYKKCTVMQGGLIFDYSKKRCDFPQNVCEPVGTRSEGCGDGELESSGEMPPLLDRIA